MSTHLAESPIPTSPPSPSAPPAPSPGQLPAQSSPPLRKFQPHGALCHRPCSQSSVCFPTLSLWLYAGHTCVFVGVLHQDKLPGGAAAAAAFGGAPGGTRASLDAEPEMELRKPALCCGGPLLGVLSSESESSPRARLAEEEKRAGRVEITCGFSPSPASVRPIPGGALGLATPQIPSALRLGALSCLTPGTPTTGHWLQAAPQASVYKGGG